MVKNAELIVIIRTEENELNEQELWRFERDISMVDVQSTIKWFKNLLNAWFWT